LRIFRREDDKSRERREMKPENVVVNFVNSLEVKEIEIKDKLFLACLDSTLTAQINYLTLDEALKQNAVIIKERDAEAVSEFKVKNESGKMLLLLMGEQLQGEKQNRTVNTTILVGGHQGIIIPVSCTERGRWSYTDEDLRSEHLLHSTVRADLVEGVSATLVHGRGYMGEQRKVWSDIAAAYESFGIRSSTEAADDIYSSYDKRVEGILRQFSADSLTNGVLGSTENLICVDAFTRKETLFQTWNKLIKSYILDSLNCSEVEEMNKKEIIDFLRGTTEANLEVFDSPGLGQSVRITKDGLSGCCLVYEGEAIHLCLFQSRRNSARGFGYVSEIVTPKERFSKVVAGL
jgi:hypothetical protein